MERRTKQKKYYITSKENEILKKRCERLGISESEYVRSLIKGYKPKGKPTKELTKLIYEINRIGNNINQIAYVANRTNSVNYNSLKRWKTKLDNLIYDIKNEYLGSGI